MDTPPLLNCGSHTWYLGVGLMDRDDHKAPLHMASWMQRTWKGHKPHFVGVHVTHEPMPKAVGHKTKERFGQVLRVASVEAMVECGLDPSNTVELAEDRDVAQALADAAKDPSAYGMIVGRRAASLDRSLIRLGVHTRRLLWKIPRPVMVVPADVGRDGPGEGPVLVATDLSPKSQHAVEVAAYLAAGLGRELVAVLAIPMFDEATAMGDGVGVPLHDSLHQKGAAEIEGWALRHKVPASRVVVVEGDPARAIADLAGKEKACLVVAGTRGFGPVLRTLIGSVSADLAAASPAPVLIVPTVEAQIEADEDAKAEAHANADLDRASGGILWESVPGYPRVV